LVAEIEELSGRLKASRQRVADLERNFTTASNSSQKNEKVHLPHFKLAAIQCII